MSGKLVFLLSFVLILLAGPIAAYAQVENLAVNPSFEEDEVIFDDPDYEGWWTWGYDTGLDSIAEIDESTYIDGSRSLRVDPTGGTNWYFIVAYSPIPCEVGTEYTASIWVKAEEERPFWIQFKATDNTVTWGMVEFELATEWAEYAITSPAQNAEAKIELFCSASAVTLWLDFLYVYEGAYIEGLKPGGVTKATVPNPADGAIDVPRDVTLSWNAGNSAAVHDVYLGTDANDVNDADTTDTTGIYRDTLDLDVTGYVPAESPLEWGTTYYWRIDEVNDLDPNSPWKGALWSFTTINHIVVEDFEGYTDFPPDEVWNSWIDGFGDTSNGSTAGYPAPDFNAGEHYLEDDIVHSGEFSMPLFYDNRSAGISEVTKTLTEMRDWTVEDVITLTLFYRGELANAADPMYVVLNGSAVITNENPKAAQASDWTRWDISLQDFADLGVDLTDVDTMSIGFGDKADPAPGGGQGHVFFDDIRLYRTPPADVEPAPEPVDPGTGDLVAMYSFENNVSDGSGNGLGGTIMGNPMYVEGITGMGMSFDGVNDYINFGNSTMFDFTNEITLSAWVNMNDAGNGQHNPFVGKGDHAYAIKHSSGNQLQFFIYDGGWFTANVSVNASLNGSWHHVAGTFDGAEIKIYVDGALGATTEHEGTIEVQPHNLTIGNNSEEEGRFYDGVIDEVRIYDRALTANEIVYLVDER